MSYLLIPHPKANQYRDTCTHTKILKNGNKFTRPINSNRDTLEYKYFYILVQSMFCSLNRAAAVGHPVHCYRSAIAKCLTTSKNSFVLNLGTIPRSKQNCSQTQHYCPIYCFQILGCSQPTKSAFLGGLNYLFFYHSRCSPNKNSNPD